MGSGVSADGDDLAAGDRVIPEFAVWTGWVVAHVDVVDPGLRFGVVVGAARGCVTEVGEFFDAAGAAEGAV